MRERMLQGHSVLETREGEVLAVSDGDGLSRMEASLWVAYKGKMLSSVGRTVEELLDGHPERQVAFGLSEGRIDAALSLETLLGHPIAVPDSSASGEETVHMELR